MRLIKRLLTPSGRHRRTPAAWADMEQRLAELEEQRVQDGITLMRYDEHLRQILAGQHATARRAELANQAAFRVPYHGPDADTLTIEIPWRSAGRIRPPWQAPMAVAS